MDEVIIHLTECMEARDGFELDPISKAYGQLPIRKRLLFYEAAILMGRKEFWTYDEALVLTCLWMAKHGKIKARLVSHCNCDGNHRVSVAKVREDGEIDGQLFHGLFEYRAKYLFD